MKTTAQVKLQKGFTLIELIIVIAILGILAAVVVAAMNPVEQLARGRDAGRITAVGQLGRVMQAYTTNNSGVPLSVAAAGATDTTLGTWQNFLTASKDLTNTITITAPTACVAALASFSDSQGGICYGADANPPTKYVVWTTVESNSELIKANGGGAACAAGRGEVIYDSTKGQTQVGCQGTTAGANPITSAVTYYNP